MLVGPQGLRELAEKHSYSCHMLYIHCGMPRTSTSSLQVALAEHEDRLAAEGVFYPERWRSKGVPTHHGLHGLLKASQDSDRELDDFKRFLVLHSKNHLLFSAEILTLWMTSSERQKSLLAFLAAAQEIMPTRCIWTLRRRDELFVSLYLRRLGAGVRLLPPAVFFAKFPEPDCQFARFRSLEDALGGNVVYVKYDSTGKHNDELLHAFGIPDRVRSEIRENLERSPRLNASLSHKQAVVLLNLDALAARAGIPLDEVVLRKAFRSGEVEFAQDRPCELVSDHVRKALHDGALVAASRQAFEPYLEFFGDSQIDGCSSTSLAPEEITDQDLAQLVALMSKVHG
jgi:hypothetical protein